MYPIATRLAPSDAKRSAIAFPIPLAPPVTRTEAPSKLIPPRGSGSDAGADEGIVSQPIRLRGSRLPSRGQRRRVPEAVEQLHLLLAVLAHGVVGREVGDQLGDARAELVREVRRRGADEGVDVVGRRLGHRAPSLPPEKGVPIPCQLCADSDGSVWPSTCAESVPIDPQAVAR